MKLYVDFHIHTALSPCGEVDMTPHNIVRMAKLKGLDAIAITDHNCMLNAEICQKIGAQYGLIVIPGMELQTKEDIHVICLFENTQRAFEFQEFIWSRLPDVKNKSEIFGEQIIFDEYENIIGRVERLLLTSCDISFDEAFFKVTDLEGVFIPAHVDRNSYSVISNLGFIPDYLHIDYVEFSSIEVLNKLKMNKTISSEFSFIKSSDAHNLQDILEKETYIEVKGNNVRDILDCLQKK
jgi:3',5'-nucleoside bisphosphate phosphatase